MSISILPIRVGHLLERPVRRPKPQPKHSAPAEVERLRDRLKWADLRIKTQQVQLNDADRKIDAAEERRDIAEKALSQAEAVIRLRDQEIADLKRRLQVRVLAEAAATQTQELDVHAIRDNYTARVRTLPQAHGIGPVLDPGRIH